MANLRFWLRCQGCPGGTRYIRLFGFTSDSILGPFREKDQSSRQSLLKGLVMVASAKGNCQRAPANHPFSRVAVKSDVLDWGLNEGRTCLDYWQPFGLVYQPVLYKGTTRSGKDLVLIPDLLTKKSHSRNMRWWLNPKSCECVNKPRITFVRPMFLFSGVVVLMSRSGCLKRLRELDYGDLLYWLIDRKRDMTTWQLSLPPGCRGVFATSFTMSTMV